MSSRLVPISLTILLVLVLLVAMATTFFRSMTFYDHDEQMYLPAARQIMEGKSIYRDFAFNQTPYVPLLFAAAIKISGTHHYLLTGKLINLTVWFVSAAIFFMSARRFSGDIFVAACLLVLYGFNFFIMRISIVATNYILPLTLAMSGSYLILIAAGEGWKNRMRRLAAGLCLAVAVGAKLLYLPLLLPFGLALFYPARAPGQGNDALRRFWPFALGIVIGLLPVFYFFFRDPSGFIFHNIRYYLLNVEWCKQIGRYQTLDFASKLSWVFNLLKNWNYLILLLWLVCGFLLLSQCRLPALVRDFPLVFFACSVLVAFAVAGYPRPLWPEYFAIPVPYCLLLIAAIHGRFHRPLRTMNRGLALIAVLIVLALALPQQLRQLAVSIKRPPRTWPVTAIHLDGQEIRAVLGQAGLQGKVATLAPLSPQEADLPVYTQLATGFLYYRIGDFCSSRERALYHIVSPVDISELLETDPPAAILTGFEGELDEALNNFAEIHHYKKITGLAMGNVYIRPADGGNN